MLLLCLILVLAIAFGRRSDGGRHIRWVVLSLVFLYLSADEALMIHETVGTQLGKAVLLAMGFSPPGILLSRAWVVYGAGLMVVVGLICLRLIRELPGTTKRLLLGAGTLYVGGAHAGFGQSAGALARRETLVGDGRVIEGHGAIAGRPVALMASAAMVAPACPRWRRR